MNKDDLKMLKDYLKELEKEKQPYLDCWKEISKYMGLSYGDWATEESGGNPVKAKVIDTTARMSSNILADGLMGAAVGHGIAWFKYTAEDLKDDDTDYKAFTSVIAKVQKHNYKALNKSNFYDETRCFIRSCADLSTGVMYFDNDLRHSKVCFKTLHLRDVFLIKDKYNNVNSMFRYIYLNKKESKKFFGNKTPSIVNDSQSSTKKFKYVQFVGDILDWDFEELVSGVGDYLSVYWLDNNESEILKEERLARKPFAVWRWSLPVFEGSWGIDSPGMLLLPDIKFVNLLQEDMITLSELIAKGHWKVTKGLEVNLKVGSINYLEPNQDFTRMQYTGDLRWLDSHIQHYRDVIEQAYNVTLFLMLTRNIERSKTATEVVGLETEKSAMLSTILSRLGNDFLEPMHEWLFKTELESKRVDNLTEDEITSLKDKDLNIDFVSPLFMAQKRSLELKPTLEWIQDVSNLGQINPGVLDLVNFDKMVKLLHNVKGADSTILIADEDVKRAREIRAKIQAEQAQLEQNRENLKSTADAYAKTNKAVQEGSLASKEMGGK